MTDSKDKDRKTDANRGGSGTLTLKRPSIEHGKVKQSFAHGRSKTVVVETKRKRFGEDKPAASPEPRQQFQPQPKVAPSGGQQRSSGSGSQRSGVVLRTLTAEEKEARDRALAGARIREAEDRKRQEEEGHPYRPVAAVRSSTEVPAYPADQNWSRAAARKSFSVFSERRPSLRRSFQASTSCPAGWP